MPKTRRQQQAQKQQHQQQQQKKQTKAQNNKEEEKTKQEKIQTSEDEVQKKDEVKEKKKQKKQVKKYTKKSVEQKSRIFRSKHERIFLLSAERHEDQSYWHFVVQGTKGSHYNVKVSTEVHCTCTDFRIRRVPCKHIYFIVTQVGQNDELLDYFKNDKKISKKAYNILDEQLSNRLKNRLTKSKDAKDIDLKDDKDCVICFSQMDKETEPLQDCPTCKKYFHAQCIEAWKNHNTSCPLCRGALSGGGQRDPLGKLIDIKL